MIHNGVLQGNKLTTTGELQTAKESGNVLADQKRNVKQGRITISMQVSGDHRERERERQRQRQRDRERDRHRERQTDRQTETDRQTDRQRQKQTGRKSKEEDRPLTLHITLWKTMRKK